MLEKINNDIFGFLSKYIDYTQKEEIVVRYGINTLLILISKTLMTIIISLFLGITKEIITFLLLYGLLRTFAGGLHLKNSNNCTILSNLIFFCSVFSSFYLEINSPLFFIIISGIIILYCSPADTQNKPISNKLLRIKRKIISFIIYLLYTFLFYYYRRTFISNLIFLCIIENALLINPLIYKLFKQRPNNYLYMKGGD